MAERGNAVEAASVRWEKGRERARERVKEIQLFFHFTSSKKAFFFAQWARWRKTRWTMWFLMKFRPAPSCEPAQSFKSLSRIAKSLATFLSRLRYEKEREKREEFCNIRYDNLSPAIFVSIYIPQDRISKDFWIYAVWKKERKKERERENESESERKSEVIIIFARFRKLLSKRTTEGWGVAVARPGLHRRTSSSINVLCVCVYYT